MGHIIRVVHFHRRLGPWASESGPGRRGQVHVQRVGAFTDESMAAPRALLAACGTEAAHS